MRHTDFSPFYRSAIGFDRLINMLDQASGFDSEGTYPPYNIERVGDNAFRISVAVAGFTPDTLSIEVKEQTLTIAGSNEAEKGDRTFLHRGIAGRAFERRFQLADHVDVKGASFENGLLHVDLVRNLPERMKPRSIAITSGQGRGSQTQIEATADSTQPTAA